MADITFTKEEIRAGGGFALVRQYEANAAMECGETVELLGTGKVQKTAGASSGVEGVVVATSNKTASAAAGDYVSVVVFGEVNGFEDLVPGQLYYLSANAGNIADSGSIAIGYAADANTIMVSPALSDRPSS